MRGKWLAIVAMLLLPAGVFAQHSPGQTELGIFLSPTKLIGGNTDDAAISPWFGVSLGTSPSDAVVLSLEGAAGWSRPRDTQETGIMKWIRLRPGTPYRTFLFPLHAKLKYLFSPGKRFSPFMTMGVGILFWDLRDVGRENPILPIPTSGRSIHGSQKNLMGDIGAGAEYFLSETVSLNVSGAYYQFFGQDLDMSGYGDKNSGAIEARIGMVFHFGGWKDTDGDGIEDRLDLCPKAKEDFDGFQDQDGCPDLDNDGDGIPDVKDGAPNKAEDMDGFEDTDGVPDLDNDGDGIPDTLDKAPNKAEDFDGFQDDDGAPDPDNDGDGIPDAKDKCPNQPETVNGYQDDDGCPDKKPEIVLEKKKPVVLPGVTFRTGSAELTENAKRILDKVAETLKEHPEIVVEVSGHTDNVGSWSFNMKLSQRRADAVRNYLIQKGIDPSRIRAVGYGPDRPIAPNDTPEGRAKNRRIEFVRIK